MTVLSPTAIQITDPQSLSTASSGQGGGAGAQLLPSGVVETPSTQPEGQVGGEGATVEVGGVH